MSFDHDFRAHLAVTMIDGPSVILLRIEGMQARQQADLIRSVWDSCGDAIAGGAAVSTDGVALRFRRLPLK